MTYDARAAYGPAMTMIGADVEELRALAGDFTSGAAELQDLSAALARSIDAAHQWQGPDAERCKEQFGELARTRMTSVASALSAAGRLLELNAHEQEVGSAAVTAAAARPSLLSQLFTWGKNAWNVYKLPGKLMTLTSFWNALGKTTFFARTRSAILALEKAMGVMEDGGWLAKGKVADFLGRLGLPALLARIGLPELATVGKFLGRAMVPISMVLSIPDVLDGHGYQGWRGDMTKWLAVGNVVGAAVITVGVGFFGAAAFTATAPILAFGATAAMTAYGLWSLGNSLYDSSSWVRGLVHDPVATVSSTWNAGWQGARSLLEVSKSYARGLLGPSPRLAGAGT